MRDLKNHCVLNLPLNNHADDVSGYGNDGVWSGNPGYADGPFGLSVGDLNGSSFVAVSDATQYSVSSFSISVRVNPDVLTGNQGIISKRTSFGVNDEYIVYVTATGNVIYRVAGDSTNQITTAAGVICACKSQNVTVTFNGTSFLMCVYVDGVLQASGTNGSGITPASADIQIGALSSGSWINGKESNVKMFNVELTADEVLQLYKDDQRVPKKVKVSQPIPRVPDNTDTSLVGSWLNYRTRNSANDYSANGNDGTATDVKWLSTGGRFNGSSSSINLGTPAAFDFSNEISVGGWFFIETVSEYRQILRKNNAGKRLLFSIQISNTLAFGTYNGSYSELDYTSFDSSYLNRWTHIFATHDSLGNKNIYINGVSVASVNVGGTLDISGTTDLFIGSNGDSMNEYFDGCMDNVSIYSRALTASEIKAEYQRSVPDNSLVLSTDGVRDYSRFNKTLTNNGGTVVGNGMKFDGSDDYIECTDFDITDTITAMGWFKRDSVGANKVLMSKNFSAWEVQFKSTNEIRLFINSNELDSVSQPLANQWNFVAFTYDQNGGANNKKLYLNGVLEAEETQSGAITTNSNEVTLGARSGGTVNFDGMMDDVKILNEAKSADWIKLYYLMTRKYY